MGKKKERMAMLGVRSALILQIAITIGLVSGWLSYMATTVLPAALAVGLAAAGSALVALHNIIDPD